MSKVKRIRVRCYTMKEARFIMLFLMKNGFEGVTNDSYRDCDLSARIAFDSDGVCFVGIALSRGASMRVSNLHDSVARKDYVEVSKSKFISEVTKFKQLLRKPWKDGDVLIDEWNTESYVVFKEYGNKSFFRAYFVLLGKEINFDELLDAEHYRLANAEEMRKAPMLFYFLLNNLDAVRRCLPKKVNK